MLLVALMVVLATAAGVLLEHHAGWAVRAAQGCLTLMLYALVPFISYVSFAHLQLSLGGGVGLAIAYCGLALAAVVTWSLGRRLGVSRPTLGGMIVCALMVNTGYLGYPMSVALLGSGALSHAVAYDQVVSSPMLFTGGFAVGAVFGGAAAGAGGWDEAGGWEGADGLEGADGREGAHRREEGDGWETVRRRVRAFFTRNPPMWAAVAGLLVPSAWAPSVLVSASHDVVNALLVFGFLSVGIFLSSERREDNAPLLELPNRQVLMPLAGRFCVNPVLLGLVSLAGVAIPTPYLLQALMPSGISCLLVGHAYGLNQRMIATVIVWSTILVLVGASVAYWA